MKIKQKNKKGISLIVLVITIIVMIILAGAIILSLNSSGIIGKANKAKLSADKANMLEAAGVALSEYELEKQMGELDPANQTAEDYVKDKLDDQFAADTLNQLSVLDDGTIQVLPTIPEGFVMSPYAGEQKISEGLVIYETDSLTGIDKETAMTTYNQYVWVPVEGTFERIAWNYENLTNDYVEPIRADIPYIESDMSKYANEIAQYNAMKASVETNGGFYIARYEAGLPEGKTASTVKIDGTDKPVSKKGATVWNNIAWDSTWNFDWDTYVMISDVAYGDDSQDGAAKISKEVVGADSNVVSHLIYGVQWDAVMNFMKDIENPNVPGKKYIYDSTGMGVYGEEEAATGSSENYKVKNIYDMAGNVWEWTYEVLPDTDNDFGGRVIRGGWCDYNGYDFPASDRDWYSPDDAAGFRFVLYIK